MIQQHFEPANEAAPVSRRQNVRWFALFDTRDGMRRYILRAWLIGFIPSMLIAGLLGGAGLFADEARQRQLGDMPEVELIVLLLAFAPIVESLLLSATLGILGFFMRSRATVAAVSALIWALLHLVNGAIVPLIIAWPFFVFSVAYLAWRPRGWLRAMAVVTATHSLQNLVPAIVLLTYY
jgi:hypothetical protein